MLCYKVLSQVGSLTSFIHVLYHGNSSEISQDETQEEENNVDDPKAIRPIEDETNLFQYQNVNESLSTDKSDFISPEPPSNDSKRKSTRIEATMNELVSIMKSNSCMRSQQLSQNQSATSQSYLHDEEEMFFLSLARFVKKLKPEERIRVKSEVSQVVFQAEYRNLQNS